MNTIPTFLAALGVLPLLGLTAALGQTPQTASPLPPVVQERGGLPHVFARLKAGKPVTIAYFGGSITAGAGASDGEKTSYRALVGQWFTTTFPKASVTNVNAAIGGTGSDLGAFRLKRDVLDHHPDLVFVEFAVNDDGTPEAMVDRAIEGIARQIRRADPATDVCFLYVFVPAWRTEIESGQVHRTVRLHEAVAEHYGVPSVNWGPPVARALTAGALTQADFTHDGTHPTDAGYKIYADTLIGFLEAQRTGKTVRLRPHALPPPLRPDSLEYARMIGPDGMGPLGAGWAINTDNPTGSFPKLLASDTPGATQTVAFSGPLLAMFYVLGPDTGAFDYKIDERAWQTMNPFDPWSKDYPRSHYRPLADGLPDGDHVVTLKVRADHNPDSKGTWTRIGFLLSSPARPKDAH